MKRLHAALAASVIVVTAATATALAGQGTSAAAGFSENTLEAREPLPKTPNALLVKPHDATGRLIVKFTDDARVRAQVNGTLAAEASGVEMAGVKAILTKFQLTAVQAINQSERNLKLLQQRAALVSGRQQPDLAGMMYIDGPENSLEQAAQALNSLDIVEFVEFEVEKTPGGSPISSAGGGDDDGRTPPATPGGGRGIPGACCIPGGNCVEFDEATCLAAMGTFLGEGLPCSPDGTTACDQGVCCVGDSCDADLDYRTECVNAGGNFVEGGDCADTPCLRGACCIPGVGCQTLTQAQCVAQGGTYFGFGTQCSPNETCATGVCCVDDTCTSQFQFFTTCNIVGGTFIPDGVCDEDNDPCDETDGCGEALTGSCYNVDGNGSPYCTDLGCCEFICQEIDSYCCDDEIGEWDVYCAASASRFCPGAPPLDVCRSPISGPCYEANSGAGCRQTGCCITVCGIESFCCDQQWDEACALLAIQNCPVADPSGPTPDLTANQGYLTAGPYDPFPPAIAALLPLAQPGSPGNGFDGYDGEGHDLAALRALAQELYDDYGVDGMEMGPIASGETINVAVIEWGWWGPEPFTDTNGNGQWDPGEPFSDLDGDGVYSEGHEDLDVITEPGQTLIQIPEVTEPNHGTACLSIINAKDNGVGMTGIAPGAQAYFFPLTSVEEGPRELTAWTNAILTLRPGDVISASYGPTPDNLNTQAASALLFRLASDSGITVCISAGNSCFDLDNATDFGDTGAIVVGACSPGSPWYRLSFSNYYSTPDPGSTRSNSVHVRAWGELVASAAYGDLSFNSGDRHQAYTVAFNGTSAAAPQVAGLVASLQSLAKQFYGIPVPPEFVRAALKGSRPSDLEGANIRLFGAMESDIFCTLDVGTEDEPALSGTYPRLAGSFGSAGSRLINSIGFADSPNLTDLVVIRGDTLFGNKYSVKGSDNYYLVIESMQTARNFRPAFDPSFPELSQVEYLASGQIVDLVAVGRAPVTNFNTIEIVTEQAYPGLFTIQFIELYDWSRGSWQFVAVNQMNGEPEGGADYTFANQVAFKPTSYVNSDDDRILVRIWALGLTGPGSGGGPGIGGLPVLWTYNLDNIQINFLDEFGEELP